MTPVIDLRGVRVARGARTLLDIPALSVEEGEVLSVMGPNGAGKSTLLRVLGLLEAPTAGSVRFQGEPVSPGQGLAVRRRMASVFQDPLLADASVFDNVALGLRFRGVAEGPIEARVMRWLERFGIAALGRRHARTLSGGEAQRAALARALVLEPELLLLDEPFSALDQPTRETLLRDLRGILRAERTTTVLVTHHRGEALALGDRVAVLIGGRILQVGDPAQVFRAPVSAEVARFVGLETILDCPVIGRNGSRSVLQAGARAIEAAQPADPGERVLLCLRPEDVGVRPLARPGERERAQGQAQPKASGPAEQASGADMKVEALADGGVNRVPGRIVQVMPTPLHVRVVIDCGFPLVALVTHRSVEEWGLREGALVTAEFGPAAAHLIRSEGGFRAPQELDSARLDSAGPGGV